MDKKESKRPGFAATNFFQAVPKRIISLSPTHLCSISPSPQDFSVTPGNQQVASPSLTQKEVLLFLLLLLGWQNVYLLVITDLNILTQSSWQ